MVKIHNETIFARRMANLDVSLGERGTLHIIVNLGQQR
jgi:hypothetical protein